MLIHLGLSSITELTYAHMLLSETRKLLGMATEDIDEIIHDLRGFENSVLGRLREIFYESNARAKELENKKVTWEAESILRRLCAVCDAFPQMFQPFRCDLFGRLAHIIYTNGDPLGAVQCLNRWEESENDESRNMLSRKHDFHREMEKTEPEVFEGLGLNPKLAPLISPLPYRATGAGDLEFLSKAMDSCGHTGTIVDAIGQTPLAWAASGDHSKVTELLLKRHDIDVNRKNNRGRTPLLQAVYDNHITILEQLLAHHDVDINCRDKYGQTPLMAASKYGHEKALKILLGRPDVDVNSQDDDGATALLHAAYAGRSQIVNALLHHVRLDVNIRNRVGETALYIASQRGHEIVVKLLLQNKGTDVNAANHERLSPLSAAAGNGRFRVVQLLLDKRDVDVNFTDLNGRTALALAARFGDINVVILLCRRKEIFINTIDKEGQSPLSVAKKMGHYAIADILLDYTHKWVLQW